MRPTADAFRPVRRARARGGRTVGICLTPRERRNICADTEGSAGRGRPQTGQDTHADCSWKTAGSKLFSSFPATGEAHRKETHEKRKNARMPAKAPPRTSAILKSSWVLPGPGRAPLKLNKSANVVPSSQGSEERTNSRLNRTMWTPGPPNATNPKGPTRTSTSRRRPTSVVGAGMLRRRGKRKREVGALLLSQGSGEFELNWTATSTFVSIAPSNKVLLRRREQGKRRRKRSSSETCAESWRKELSPRTQRSVERAAPCNALERCQQGSAVRYPLEP